MQSVFQSLFSQGSLQRNLGLWFALALLAVVLWLGLEKAHWVLWGLLVALPLAALAIWCSPSAPMAQS